MRWPFRRSPVAAPSPPLGEPAAALAAAPRLAAPAASGGGWEQLPALHTTLAAPPLVAPSARFYEATHGHRPLLTPRPLLHRPRDADAPGGVVEGVAWPRPAAASGVDDPGPSASAEMPASVLEAFPPRSLNAVAAAAPALLPLTQAAEPLAIPPPPPALVRAATTSTAQPPPTAADQAMPPGRGPDATPAPASSSHSLPPPPAAGDGADQAGDPLLGPQPRRRNLGESRRLGLGAPLVHRPPESGATSGAPRGATDRPGAPPPAPTPTAAPAASPETGDDRGEPPPAPPAPPARPRSRLGEPLGWESSLGVGLPPRPPARAIRPGPLSGAELGAAAPALLSPPAAAPPVPVLQPVPAELRQAIRRSHSVDVGDAVVRRDPDATRAARAAGARALTRGGEIALPAEHGPVDRPLGRGLLAHELVHAAQQRRYGPDLPLEHSPAGRRLEAEAQEAERYHRGDQDAPVPATAAPLTPAGGDLGQSLQQSAAELLASGFAERGPAGELRFPAGRAAPSAAPAGARLATAAAAQRADGEPALPPVAALAPEDLGGVVPPVVLPATTATAPAAAPAPSAEHEQSVDIDALFRQLYVRLRRQLCRELLVERERAGLVTDLR